MLKITETEETICCFCRILTLVAFQLGADPLDPPATPMVPGLFRLVQTFNLSLVLVLRCHYSPPRVFSIKINFKINFAQKHNNKNALHNLMARRD